MQILATMNEFPPNWKHVVSSKF